MEKYADSDRFVVTGMGMVSPVGNDPESSWQTIKRGEHGVTYVRNTLLEGYESLPIHIAATVKDFNLKDNPAFAPYYKEARAKWDLSQQFILWAGAQALKQSLLITGDSLKVENQIDPERFGIYVGTGVGGANGLADVRAVLENERIILEQAFMNGDQETIDKYLEDSRLNPKTILKSLPGRVAGTPSIVFGAKAFWKGILQECASGNGAIISAIEALKLGKADVVLAGGVEGDITISTVGMFGAAGAVNKTRNPEGASRPYDKDRKGLVMGQGAGALVIERMDHAQNRGVPILAEIVGYGENADAKYDSEPDPVSVVRCLRQALEMVDKSLLKRPATINSHATSTFIGDQVEMKTLTEVFPANSLVGIGATKGATGHTFGASGAIEAILSIQALRYNLTPPIINLDNPIDEARGYEHLMSSSGPIEGEAAYAVNTSFGFGGNNAITIFARPR